MLSPVKKLRSKQVKLLYMRLPSEGGVFIETSSIFLGLLTEGVFESILRRISIVVDF
jgi:hypothetical protein